MSGTVAIDTVRVEDREPRPGAGGPAAGLPAECTLRDDQTVDLGAAPPPWPRRKLNEALADLGPLRPQGRVAREPWSRSKMPRSDASSTSAPANDDGIAVLDKSEASTDAPTTSVGNIPGLGVFDLPPPSRPSRQTVVQVVSASTADPFIENWDAISLAEDDAAGADIVRALAEVNRAFDGVPIRPLVEVRPLDGDEPLERPPMIIERAIAEQGQGRISRQPVAISGNPMPGLAVGFTLSLMAGAALYLALASG